MPGQMPEMLSRGPNLLALDQLLVAGSTRDAVLVELEKLAAMPNFDNPNAPADQINLRKAFVALSMDVNSKVFNAAAGQHFNDDWLNEDEKNTWWPNAQPVAPVLIKGYITAIKIAQGAAGTPRAGQGPLDIESLWVCTPPKDQDAGTEQTGRVHVGITWSAKLVVVIIYTPRLPDRAVTPPQQDDVTDPVVIVRWHESLGKVPLSDHERPKSEARKP